MMHDNLKKIFTGNKDYPDGLHQELEVMLNRPEGDDMAAIHIVTNDSRGRLNSNFALTLEDAEALRDHLTTLLVEYDARKRGDS